MDDDDFKILPDKDDLRAEARERRRKDAERAMREYEARRKTEELKEALLAGLDMSAAAVFMAKSILVVDTEDTLMDKELLKLFNELNDITEKLMMRLTR